MTGEAMSDCLLTLLLGVAILVLIAGVVVAVGLTIDLFRDRRR